jgi:hypothetical protein
MSEYGEELRQQTRSRWSGPRKSKASELHPLYITSIPLGQAEKLTLGEELVRRIEIGEELEKAFESVLRKGLRHPGTNKARLTYYLLNELEKAQREGRI